MAERAHTGAVLSAGRIHPKWTALRRMPRHVAKNLVAAGVCDEALVQVAYAIGVPTLWACT